jgi:hypothetical protein
MSYQVADVTLGLVYLALVASLIGYFIQSRVVALKDFFHYWLQPLPVQIKTKEKYQPKVKAKGLVRAILVYPSHHVFIATGQVGKVTVRHNISLPPNHHIQVQTIIWPFSGLILLNSQISEKVPSIDLYYLNASKHQRVFTPEDAIARLYVVEHKALASTEETDNEPLQGPIF